MIFEHEKEMLHSLWKNTGIKKQKKKKITYSEVRIYLFKIAVNQCMKLLNIHKVGTKKKRMSLTGMKFFRKFRINEWTVP